MSKHTNLLQKDLTVSILDSVSQMISIKTTQFSCSHAKPALEVMPTSMVSPNNIFMCARVHMCVHSHVEPRGHFQMLLLVHCLFKFFFDKASHQSAISQEVQSGLADDSQRSTWPYHFSTEIMNSSSHVRLLKEQILEIKLRIHACQVSPLPTKPSSQAAVKS